MSATINNVKHALELKVALEAKGFSVIVAGGFARDVYFNEPPKDIDIIVAAGNQHDMESLSLALASLGEVFQAFHMYNEGVSDRIVGGFKLLNNIDVLLYALPNAHQAVEHLDFNLNQFVVLGPDTFDDAYVVFAGTDSWHELTPVRQDYSQERKAKMHEKWLNLTWRYPEGQGPARVKLADAVYHNPEL